MMEISRRSIVALAIAAFALAGCYVVPVVQDGAATHAPGPGPYALVPAGAGPVPYALAPTPVAAPGAPVPGLLQARLYPANEAATRTGMLSGTVTNLMTGKGRFQLDYAGEVLVGEATRVPGDERAGLANAYGQRGTYMTCRYTMTTPYQGTGTCTLSTGALYQVHLGA